MFNFFLNLYLSITTGVNTFPLSHYRYGTDPEQYLQFLNIFQPILNYLGNIFNNSVSNNFNMASAVALLSYDGSVYLDVAYTSSLNFVIGCVLSIICCVAFFLFLVKAIIFLFKIIPNALTGRI